MYECIEDSCTGVLVNGNTMYSCLEVLPAAWFQYRCIPGHRNAAARCMAGWKPLALGVSMYSCATQLRYSMYRCTSISPLGVYRRVCVWVFSGSDGSMYWWIVDTGVPTRCRYRGTDARKKSMYSPYSRTGARSVSMSPSTNVLMQGRYQSATAPTDRRMHVAMHERNLHACRDS